MVIDQLEIIIGTYEEFLLGYVLHEKEGKVTLTQSFADKSHSGSIKCVAVHDRWIATGATDDRIFIYDMQTRKQSQILLTHNGTINALAFTGDGTHLLSGGDDNRMVATNINGWVTEADWTKAHGGTPVTHISCHPSGKLALSLCAGRILNTWNLVKGRVAYKTNLKARSTLGLMPDCLAWSKSGNYFSLSGPLAVEFWSVETADVVRTVKTKSKPVSICWLDEEQCLIGQEDGKVLWVDVDKKDEEIREIIVHAGRVKAISLHEETLVTISSAGELKVWQLHKSEKELTAIATTNIGCRPTCLAVLDISKLGKDYVVSEITNQTEKVRKPKSPKPAQQERGVVTIEYDDDDEQKEEEEEDIASNDLESEGDHEFDDDSVPGSDEDDTEQASSSKSKKRKKIEIEETQQKSKLKKKSKIYKPDKHKSPKNKRQKKTLV